MTKRLDGLPFRVVLIIGLGQRHILLDGFRGFKALLKFSPMYTAETEDIRTIMT